MSWEWIRVFPPARTQASGTVRSDERLPGGKALFSRLPTTKRNIRQPGIERAKTMHVHKSPVSSDSPEKISGGKKSFFHVTYTPDQKNYLQAFPL